ncbi:hypothetical protein EYF80_057809 [Liparis tanakae]|uniref:Uncharacterized protein n=1 Tax=Liparis tanakae TaxID=230148 RepID=A0A4Z2ETR2_9TELE|nr:hypothetical protein EYF80_057809 [Liparis tanakae]
MWTPEMMKTFCQSGRQLRRLKTRSRAKTGYCVYCVYSAGWMKKGRVFMAPLNSCLRANRYSASSPPIRGRGFCSIT